MTRRRRPWSVIQWIGAGIFTLLVVLYAASGWRSFRYTTASHLTAIVITEGRLGIGLAEQPDRWSHTGGLQSGSHPFRLQFDFARNSRTRWSRELWIPLWLPLLLTGLATIGCHRLARPAPPWACESCGYDLKGNQSGRCPECGNAVSSDARKSRRDSPA